MIRLTGTFTGITGIGDGKDYVIQSIDGDSVTIAAAASGTWAVGSTATARLSAWQPGEWNMAMVTFGSSGTSDPQRYFGSPLGATSIMDTSQSSGVSGQRTFDLWPSMDRLCIGCGYQNSTLAAYFRGEIAHVALFAPKLATVEEADELLDTRPSQVTYGPPVGYWPFTSSLVDEIGTNHMQAIGSPIVTTDDPYPGTGPTSITALAAYYEMLRRVR